MSEEIVIDPFKGDPEIAIEDVEMGGIEPSCDPQSNTCEGNGYAG